MPEAAAGAGGAAAGSGTGSGGAGGAAVKEGGAGAANGAAGAGGSSGAGAGDAAGGTGGAAAGSGAGGATGGAADAGGSSGAGTGDNWGANWRESYAEKDEGKLNVLKRYATPRDVITALFSARQKIDSGELKAPLPKNPTAEQLAAYRKDNGIPEKPEAYFDGLPDTIKLSDADKAMLTDYVGVMHKHNLNPEAARDFLAARQGQLDKLVESRLAEDARLRTQTEDALRAEWGNDYRSHVNNIEALLSTAPPEVRDTLKMARAPDGTPFFDTKEARLWLAQLAFERNGFSAPVGDGGNVLDARGVDERLDSIKKLMGDSNSEYYKGPRAEKLQKEFRDLVDSQERMKKRVA